MTREQNLERFAIAAPGALEQVICRIGRNISICRPCVVARLRGVAGHNFGMAERSNLSPTTVVCSRSLLWCFRLPGGLQ